jgi:arabinosaccharide transport system substrate-binding protein
MTFYQKQAKSNRRLRTRISAIAVAVFAGLFLIPQPRDPNDGGGRTVTIWSFSQMLGEFYEVRHEIEKKFNIKLEFHMLPQNSFLQRLQAAMQDGEKPVDIINWIFEGSHLTADPRKTFALPLDEFVKNSALMKNMPRGKLSWLTVGGHLYGLTSLLNPVVLVYNDNLWKEAGVDIAQVKTWDDFFEAAKKLIVKQADGKPLHYALPYSTHNDLYDNQGLVDTMFMIWQQTGADIMDDAGLPALNNQRFKQFVEKWLAWKKSGVFCDWDWGNFAALLKNGTMASYISPDWWISQLNDAVKGGNYQFKVRELPVYESGNGARTATWGGDFYAISKTAKDPAFIYKIIEYKLCGDIEWAKQGIKYGMLFAVPAAWNDPVFHQPDDRFGGQKLAEFQIECAKGMPSVVMGDVFWDAIEDFNAQYKDMASGKITVDEGLKRTQAAVLKRMK